MFYIFIVKLFHVTAFSGQTVSVNRYVQKNCDAPLCFSVTNVSYLSFLYSYCTQDGHCECNKVKETAVRYCTVRHTHQEI